MGTSFTELLLVIAVSLILLVAIVLGLQKAREGSNQSEVIQGVYMLRTNIDQMYSGSSYNGLNNSIVVQAELAPKSMIRNNALRTAYGAVSVEASSETQYSIELADITKSGCQQIGRLSPDSWASIEINGTDVLDFDSGSVDPSSLITACDNARNVIKFTTP